MNMLRRLFSGGGSAPDSAIHLYARCNRCGSPVHARIDPRNDLAIEYSDDDQPTGYRLIKEMMDSRCFQLMRAEVEYDRSRHETSRRIDGGTFLSQPEYERLVAQGEQERTAGQ